MLKKFSALLVHFKRILKTFKVDNSKKLLNINCPSSTYNSNAVRTAQHSMIK